MASASRKLGYSLVSPSVDRPSIPLLIARVIENVNIYRQIKQSNPSTAAASAFDNFEANFDADGEE